MGWVANRGMGGLQEDGWIIGGWVANTVRGWVPYWRMDGLWGDGWLKKNGGWVACRGKRGMVCTYRDG